MHDDNHELIHDAIVGAFGLEPGETQVSIKGDASMRETVPIRPRQTSVVDRHAQKLLEVCEWLLKKTGCYSIYIGFNSSEIRTESVFNPFSYEIHDAENLVKEDYCERHFIEMPYQEKMRFIHKLRSITQKGLLREYMPLHWRKSMGEEHTHWRPLAKDQIRRIIESLNQLRKIDGFYLRNAAISLSQRVVRASFNCDGTYIVAAEHFPRFVEDSI